MYRSLDDFYGYGETQKLVLVLTSFQFLEPRYSKLGYSFYVHDVGSLPRNTGTSYCQTVKKEIIVQKSVVGFGGSRT